MNCWCGGMADTADSKSVAISVRVQVSPPAPKARWSSG